MSPCPNPSPPISDLRVLRNPASLLQAREVHTPRLRLTPSQAVVQCRPAPSDFAGCVVPLRHSNSPLPDRGPAGLGRVLETPGSTHRRPYRPLPQTAVGAIRIGPDSRRPAATGFDSRRHLIARYFDCGYRPNGAGLAAGVLSVGAHLAAPIGRVAVATGLHGCLGRVTAAAKWLALFPDSANSAPPTDSPATAWRPMD